MFPPDCVTDSSVMYTAMLGINVYSSSRNFNYFSVLASFWRRQGGLADLTAALPCHRMKSILILIAGWGAAGRLGQDGH